MGKKKSPRDSDSGWEDGSSVSSWTTAGDNSTSSDMTIDLFHTSLEHLFEKRRETREKASAALIGFLRDDVRVEDCMQNEATIIGRCVQGLRRGGNLEAALSAQLFGLHLITLPEPQETHLREAQFDLQRAAASGTATEVRVAAIDALAMACFVSAEDDTCCLEVMEKLQALWSSGDARSMAAAVRGWCLIFTQLNAPLSNERLESALGQLARLLQAQDVEVRGAAGEALALLYHTSRGGRGTLQRLAEQEEYGAGDEEYEEEGEHMIDSESTQEMVGRMRQLAVAHHEADRTQRSRKDRASMKATFRGILATVERGAVQPAKVKLQHGDTLVVDTLEGTVQLAAVRKYLAGGFQVHLQRNTLLHSLFNFTPRAEPASRLTALEKRATRSPCSAEAKWRTHERKGDRALKLSRGASAIIEEDA